MQVMWAKKVGLIDLTAENTLLFDRLTEGSWLIEIVFGLPAAYAKYQEGASLERQLSKQVPTPKLELRKARSLKNAGLLELVQLFSDLPIALHFLNMTGDTPHGIFGLLGVVSSLIGCWQVWPTPA